MTWHIKKDIKLGRAALHKLSIQIQERFNDDQVTNSKFLIYSTNYYIFGL